MKDPERGSLRLRTGNGTPMIELESGLDDLRTMLRPYGIGVWEKRTHRAGLGWRKLGDSWIELLDGKGQEVWTRRSDGTSLGE